MIFKFGPGVAAPVRPNIRCVLWSIVHTGNGTLAYWAPLRTIVAALPLLRHCRAAIRWMPPPWTSSPYIHVAFVVLRIRWYQPRKKAQALFQSTRLNNPMKISTPLNINNVPHWFSLPPAHCPTSYRRCTSQSRSRPSLRIEHKRTWNYFKPNLVSVINIDLILIFPKALKFYRSGSAPLQFESSLSLCVTKMLCQYFRNISFSQPHTPCGAMHIYTAVDWFWHYKSRLVHRPSSHDRAWIGVSRS